MPCQSQTSQFQTGTESPQVGVDRDPLVPDRRFEIPLFKGQNGAAGDGPQDHGADHASAFAGGGVHIEKHGTPGQFLRRAENSLTVEPAVTHGRLFRNGVDAMRGSDEQGAIGRHEPVFHGPSGLHQFRHHGQIDPTGRGIEPQYRLPPVQVAARYGVDLQIISGRTGSLGHTGDGSGLHRIAAGHCRGDEPIGKHTTALAAQGTAQDGQRFRA